MALDMFLTLTAIGGESKDSGFEGAIDVLAYSWGASDVDAKAKPAFQDLSLTHYVDAASVDLLRALTRGTRIADGTLSVRRAGATASLVYIELALAGVRVTSISAGGSGGEDRLTENITLSYEKLTVTYVQQDETGAPLAPESAGYDLVQSRPL